VKSLPQTANPAEPADLISAWSNDGWFFEVTK